MAEKCGCKAEVLSGLAKRVGGGDVTLTNLIFCPLHAKAGEMEKKHLRELDVLCQKVECLESVIDHQAKKIRVLREALKPFATCAQGQPILGPWFLVAQQAWNET